MYFAQLLFWAPPTSSLQSSWQCRCMPVLTDIFVFGRVVNISCAVPKEPHSCCCLSLGIGLARRIYSEPEMTEKALQAFVQQFLTRCHWFVRKPAKARGLSLLCLVDRQGRAHVYERQCRRLRTTVSSSVEGSRYKYTRSFPLGFPLHHINRSSPQAGFTSSHFRAQSISNLTSTMGLIGSGIKYGGLFLIAREGMKTYEKHHEKKQQQQQGQRSNEPAPYDNQYAQSSQQFELPQNAPGSFHQVWCNRNCGGRCIPAETWRSLGVDMPAAPAPQYDAKVPAA